MNSPMTNEVVCAMAKREPIGSRTFKRANYANPLNQKASSEGFHAEVRCLFLEACVN